MWADYIAYYGAIALFGLGWITQLLDLFGVAGYFNFMVWGWGLGVVGPLAAGVAMLLAYISYEKLWNCMLDEDETVFTQMGREGGILALSYVKTIRPPTI